MSPYIFTRGRGRTHTQCYLFIIKLSWISNKEASQLQMMVQIKFRLTGLNDQLPIHKIATSQETE